MANTDPSGHASRLIARRALFERLSTGESGTVTLVSAPAGTGKTVLLRSWIEDSGLAGRVAWVTVERGEQDPQRFWLFVVDALRAASGEKGFVEKLVPSPDFDGRAVVERLISELGLLEVPAVLVIDDLHELNSKEACSQLETLLGCRPPLLRVILSTRHDPQLGLHRLRLTGELVEIRDADLRFTLDEAEELLAAAGVGLSQEAVVLLHDRTEGWAAGLRLAALSLTGHPDPDRSVADFSGSERTVADYLLAEVLERQPDDVRQLLLRTSILGRVNGALADSLLCTSGSERILHALEQQNAFVVSLDAERSWFRYHQLFGDLLRLELRRTDPSVISELHRSAAAWYVEHGYVVDAVRHAQAAEDWSHATRLLAEHGFSLALDGQDAAVGSLLAAFPPALASEPELALLSAYRELSGGSFEDAAAYVGVAERNAQAVGDQRLRHFEIELAVVRLTLARVNGDFSRVIGEAQRLSELIETQSETHVAFGNDGRAVALMNLGIVEMWASRIDEGERHLQQGVELARRISRPFIEVTCLSHLALIASRRSYHEARELCGEALTIAEAQGWGGRLVACVALATMGLADLSQGRFEEAEHWLDQAERAVRPNTEPATALLVHLARGMLLLALGRFRQAQDTLGAVDRLQAVLATPHILTVQVRWFLVQTQLKLADIAAARATLAEMSDEERTWGEADVATASLLLAEGNMRGVVDVLAPVLSGAVPVLRDLSVVEALLLDAIARDRLGERQAAESDIERALSIAEPEALIFPFVVLPARELLERHPRHRTAHGGLLSMILDVLAGSAVPTLRCEAGERPAEDLSDSELRVLRFLPSNLSAPEIAAELYLSTSTVKTHMRHIYAKLGVHRRTEALERARQLGLLGPSSRVRR